MENAQNNEIVKFEAGKTYYYRFITSYDTIVRCTVTKRTAKTITFKDDCGETMTRRIYILDGVEKVDIAHYSMAPSLGADRSAEALDKAEAEAKLAEAAKEAEEEAGRLEAKQKTIAKVNETGAEAVKAHPISEGKPFVVIPFSEMFGLPGFRGDKPLTLSVKAADLILGTLDMWQHEIRETSDYFVWYNKTDCTIHYTENGEESTYQGRYDIGDGEGGLLNHIRSFGEWHRTHEEFGAEKAIPDETNEILEFVKMLEKAA